MNEDNYGFIFNDIKINNGVFNKKSKNELGKMKINNEIEFYLYIIKNNIDFSIPKLIGYEDGNLSIEYILNSSTLTNRIDKTNVFYYIEKIQKIIQTIHEIRKPVSFDIIKSDLNIELKRKIMDRFNEYDWNSNTLYNSIHSVNNIKFKNVNYYCDIIYNKIVSYLTLYQNNNSFIDHVKSSTFIEQSKELDGRNYYNLIHGDIHLGNILQDENDNIYFIDPRGYFGESKLFGLYEYDYAKLMFGLSGYSVFDNTTVNEMNIINGNIEIDFIKEYEYIFESGKFDKITILFCLSIWLGNNSCFSNINKKITSLMIAFYYCEKYLEFTSLIQ